MKSIKQILENNTVIHWMFRDIYFSMGGGGGHIAP